MEEHNKHSWCVNAYHGMSANNDGTTKMCCMTSDKYMLDLTTKSIAENFDNPKAKIVRLNLQNGVRDSSCKLCWDEEDAGRKSKRMRDNEMYFRELSSGTIKPFTGLAKFELNLGNTCNIKCRTCNYRVSSSWMKEEYDLNQINFYPTYKQFADKNKKYHQTYDEDSSFWEDLEKNLSTIKQFDFYGGEPFMSKKMWEILKICVDKGYSNDIELHYNTNGTHWPKEIEIWKNFKSINLNFSIDGIGDRFEYMRFPAKWDDVKENMTKARVFKEQYNNMLISWCITLSNLNIFYVEEILDEFYKNWSDFGMYLNLVHGPKHWNISFMPNHVKSIVVPALESAAKKYPDAAYQITGIIGFIDNGSPNKQEWDDFLHYTKKHDVYREQDFSTTFKEFAEKL